MRIISKIWNWLFNNDIDDDSDTETSTLTFILSKYDIEAIQRFNEFFTRNWSIEYVNVYGQFNVRRYLPRTCLYMYNTFASFDTPAIDTMLLQSNYGPVEYFNITIDAHKNKDDIKIHLYFADSVVNFIFTTIGGTVVFSVDEFKQHLLEYIYNTRGKEM